MNHLNPKHDGKPKSCQNKFFVNRVNKNVKAPEKRGLDWLVTIIFELPVDCLDDRKSTFSLEGLF